MFTLNCGIFNIILAVPRNIVMDLNNVMFKANLRKTTIMFEWATFLVFDLSCTLRLWSTQSGHNYQGEPDIVNQPWGNQ